MIDRTLLREHTQEFITALKSKDPNFAIEELIALDEKVRELQHEVEELRHKKNELADLGKKGVSEELKERSRALSNLLKEKTAELEAVEAAFKSLYLFCPNLPEHDVPVGNKPENKVVKTFFEKPHFSFTPKNHVELGDALKWFDFEAAARMTGSNFALYKDDAVKLLYSLAMFMLKNNIKHGFTPILPPYLITGQSLYAAAQFPKFQEQVYEVGADGLYLTPTAEVNLTNLYRDHILESSELPVRMTSWTSCFRREAGSYGAHERGLIRIHQFEKVELYTICSPDQADAELMRMLACAEDILQQLGLHYRVSLLATQDMSFAAAKTLDLEVWLPGQGSYYEVSSASNCSDFQARRAAIRYRPQPGSKPELVYTLNCSSLALPRLMVAIMETFQQADGSIRIPEVLKKEGLL